MDESIPLIDDAIAIVAVIRRQAVWYETPDRDPCVFSWTLLVVIQSLVEAERVNDFETLAGRI